MSAYYLAPDADTNWTCRLDEIRVAPRRLVAVFGPPAKVDGYKVSGEYVFSDAAGSVFTVYDWKSTTLYEDYVVNCVAGIPTP